VLSLSAKTALSLFVGGFLCSSLVRGDSVFDFESDTAGTPTTFTDTIDGLSATFSSSHDPGGFVVDSAGLPAPFATLSGNVLGDPGLLGLGNLTLTVTFSVDVSSISLNFAVNAFSPTAFTLNAFDSGIPVGSATATGSIPMGFSFPEGSISFSGADFDSVTLSTPAPFFAVDDIAVTATVIPEPGGLAAIGVLLVAMIVLGRLRFRLP
jgi:hypothetical protein